MLVDLHARAPTDDELEAILRGGAVGFGILYGRYDVRFDQLMGAARHAAVTTVRSLGSRARRCDVARTQIDRRAARVRGDRGRLSRSGMTPAEIGVFGHAAAVPRRFRRTPPRAHARLPPCYSVCQSGRCSTSGPRPRVERAREQPHDATTPRRAYASSRSVLVCSIARTRALRARRVEAAADARGVRSVDTSVLSELATRYPGKCAYVEVIESTSTPPTQRASQGRRRGVSQARQGSQLRRLRPRRHRAAHDDGARDPHGDDVLRAADAAVEGVQAARRCPLSFLRPHIRMRPSRPAPVRCGIRLFAGDARDAGIGDDRIRVRDRRRSGTGASSPGMPEGAVGRSAGPRRTASTTCAATIAASICSVVVAQPHKTVTSSAAWRPSVGASSIPRHGDEVRDPGTIARRVETAAGSGSVGATSHARRPTWLATM